MRHLSRSCGLALALLAVLAAVAFAAPRASVSGTWSCCGAGGAAPKLWILHQSGGRITGVGELPSGRVFAAVTGTVRGRKFTMTFVYNSFAPGYIAHVSGTAALGRKRLTGSWSSNRSQSGTFTATLAHPKRKKHRALRRSR